MVRRAANKYESGQEIVPGYTLVSRLGSGMAGHVWVARAAGGMRVAVKIVPLAELGGKKELRALKTIRSGNVRHPNLCPVHGFWLRDEHGRLLEEGETEAALPNSTIDVRRDTVGTPEPESAEPDAPASDSTPLTGTMPIGAVHSRSSDSTPLSAGRAPSGDAEELIVVMGLGDCTLFDRLAEVRLAAGIDPDDTETVGGLTPAETISYLRDAASAIDELHQKHDICHCDIKPQNILLLGGGVQVCDFGLATRVESDSRATGQIFASPAYAAPEILVPQEDGPSYSKPGDQYSLAVSYFELCTGLLPFTTTTREAITLAKANGQLELEHVSPAERKVLQKALSVDPLERYDSCTEFIDELAIAAGVVRLRGIKPIRLAFAALLIIAATAWIAKWLFPGGGDPAEQLAVATQNYEAFEKIPSPSYDTAREPLRDSLEAASSAYDQADGELKAGLSEISRRSASKLNQLISSRISAGNVKEWSDQIAEDLAFIRELASGEVFGDSPAANGKLQADANAARVQLSLANSETPPPELVSELRDHVMSANHVVGAVTLATIHAPDTTNFIDSVPLQDIANAESAIRLDRGSEELPKACRESWDLLQKTFLKQLEKASIDPATPQDVRQTIKNTWPSISFDADLNEIASTFKAGQWSSAADQISQIPSLDNEPENSMRRQKVKVFQLAGTALGSPHGLAKTLQDLTNLFDQSQSSLTTFFREPLASWLDEAARRRLVAGGTQVVDTKEIRQREAVFATRLGIGRSLAVARLLVFSSLVAGPGSFDEGDTQAAAGLLNQDRTDGLSRWIVSAFTAESEFADGRRLAGSKVRPIEKTLSDVSPIQGLAGLHPSYVVYLNGVVKFHQDDRMSAAKQWHSIRKQSVSFRSQLGVDRCRLVANALLTWAGEESGVRDDEVLRRRYVDSQRGVPFVEEAGNWLDRVEDQGTPPYKRLQIEQLLIRTAQLTSSEQPRRISVDAELRKLVAAPNPRSDDGQLCRAVFEIDLATAPANQLNLFLRSAVAVLDIGLRRGTLRPTTDWIDQILKPAMAKLRRDAKPTLSDKGWIFATAVDRPALRVFCKYFHESDRNLFLSDSLDYLSSHEMSAAILAQPVNQSTSKSEDETSEQLSRWLQAVEYLLRQIKVSGDTWNATRVNQLAYYLREASKLDNNNPEIEVQKAFGRYHAARLRAKKGESTPGLQSASVQLGKAITTLEKSGVGSITLYNAYWRHAGILVIQAFLDKDAANKKEILKQAVTSADAACNLLESLDLRQMMRVKKELAYLALGNASEDLAFYCDWPDDRTRKVYFDKARLAFSQAVTENNSMKARYCLARSLYRTWMFSGSQRSAKLLAEADKSLGKFDDDASPGVKAEWLSWNAQIKYKLGRNREGHSLIAKAFKLLNENEEAISQKWRRDEVVLLYCDSLNALSIASGNDASMDREVVSVLSKFFPNTEPINWKSKRQICRSLYRLNAHSELLREVESIDDSTIIEGLKKDPQGVASTLAWLAYYVEGRAFPHFLGGEPDMQKEAPRGLRWMAKIHRLLDQNAPPITDQVAATYLGFASAIAQSVDSQSLKDHVKAYLDVLPDSNPSNFDRKLNDHVRESLLDQFHFLFAADPELKQTAYRELMGVKNSLAPDQKAALARQLYLIRDAVRLDPTLVSAADVEGIRDIEGILGL